MKKLFRFLALSVIASIPMLTASAQTASPLTDSTSRAQQSEEEDKQALDRKFVETHKNDEPTAYKIAKEYLQKYPQENDHVRYLKRWVAYYETREKRQRKSRFRELLNEKRIYEAFVLGNEILASEPEDVVMLSNLTTGGLIALLSDNNTAFVAAASNYARQALTLIESGQAADKELLLGLNFALGIFTLETAPAESDAYLRKARRLADLKRDAKTYAFMAHVILSAEFAPRYEAYQSRFKTLEKKVSPEGKAVMAQLSLVLDRVIDPLARAVALAGSDTALEELKALWMNKLTELYKFRNSGYDTGLSEFIEGVLDSPSPA